ncbi:hypothetical protein C8T65DRAFT_182799 [Cerioporus squamosus]|nr:hypothetical protein C8T65DRAFT_182799 [Cerioporus squamosus]
MRLRSVLRMYHYLSALFEQLHSTMPKGIKDEEGRVIEVNDVVETKYRGGKRQGRVEAVLENERDVREQAPDLGVKVTNPPKVVFQDQHGHRVAHNPQTLSHVEPETDRPDAVPKYSNETGISTEE